MSIGTFTQHSRNGKLAVPPLKRYTVLDSNQEVLDKVAASIQSRRTIPVELNISSKDGKPHTVEFHIEGTGHDELGDLIIGRTIDKHQSINISLPTNGEPFAHLRI